MNHNLEWLFEILVVQAQDFMDGIRALNANVAVSSINDGLNINEDMGAVADYNRRVEHNLPMRPDKNVLLVHF